VFLREGLSLQTGTNNDDFTHNIVRFVGEERLALAVKRPAAVLSLTSADKLGASDMKIKVLQPCQVCHDGKIYRPGDTADVPDAVAKAWLISSWVDPGDAAAKRANWRCPMCWAPRSVG